MDETGGHLALNDLSARIPARARTAIVSLDEDAKHAVACLIPRLIDPTRGRVLIDGIDLRDVTLESLRAQVALLLEDDYLYSDTVFNNIALGDTGATLPRVVEAAKLAHAHQLIQNLPQGYDTIVGPLGHPLKPDQQYRIALARAHLPDPSIVIVEEPDTALGEDTKQLVDDAIDRLAKGRTLIFLPHRLSTIRRCDHVIVIHNGRVEAIGNPRDVHGQSKLFRHIQYLEFNPFGSGDLEPGAVGAG
jgi:ABC-type multidrug transport system fused ATPase/permease subunit